MIQVNRIRVMVARSIWTCSTRLLSFGQHRATLAGMNTPAPDHVIVERTRKAIEQDAATSMVIKWLSENGGELYAVGGVLRDSMAGIEPKDVDLLCRGLDEDELKRILRERSQGVGHIGLQGEDASKSFKVVHYWHEDGTEVEVALPRVEVSTGPGTGDWEVRTGPDITVEQDLERRDFTVNAMAMNVATGEIIDPFNGRGDYASNTLRAVSATTFRDEPVRIIRALTLHAKLGLEPDAATVAQMQAHGHDLANPRGDSVLKQLDKLMASDRPSKGLRLAQRIGVLEHFLPEVAATDGFDQRNPAHDELLFDHLMSTLDEMCKLTKDIDLRMVMLLHDIDKIASQWIETFPELDADGKLVRDAQGRPQFTQVGRYYEAKAAEIKGLLDPEQAKRVRADGMIGYQHAELGAQTADARLRHLNYPNNRRERIVHGILHHMFPGFDTPKSARKFMVRVGGDFVDDMLMIRMADQGSKKHERDRINHMMDLVNQAREQKAPTSTKELSVNGRDVIKALDIKGGPVVGLILDELLKHAIGDPDNDNPDYLLAVARSSYQRLQAQADLEQVERERELAIHREQLSQKAKEQHKAEKAREQEARAEAHAQGRFYEGNISKKRVPEPLTRFVEKNRVKADLARQIWPER